MRNVHMERINIFIFQYFLRKKNTENSRNFRFQVKKMKQTHLA